MCIRLPSFVGTTRTRRGISKSTGLTFGFAAAVFTDADRLVAAHLRQAHDPPRFNAVGVVDGICIDGTYAIDGDVTVIISARKASRKERERYGAHHLD